MSFLKNLFSKITEQIISSEPSHVDEKIETTKEENSVIETSFSNCKDVLNKLYHKFMMMGTIQKGENLVVLLIDTTNETVNEITLEPYMFFMKDKYFYRICKCNKTFKNIKYKEDYPLKIELY